MTLEKETKNRERKEVRNAAVIQFISSKKQRQAKLLGYSSQIDCLQCLSVTMAYSEHCQGIIMCERACVSLDLQCPDLEQYIAGGRSVHNR